MGFCKELCRSCTWREACWNDSPGIVQLAIGSSLLRTIGKEWKETGSSYRRRTLRSRTLNSARSDYSRSYLSNRRPEPEGNRDFCNRHGLLSSGLLAYYQSYDIESCHIHLMYVCYTQSLTTRELVPLVIVSNLLLNIIISFRTFRI